MGADQFKMFLIPPLLPSCSPPTLLLLLPLLVTSTTLGCTKRDSCKEPEHYCYQGACLTSGEYMQVKFALGTSCTTMEDCPEACRTALNPPTCGPFLRSRRTPLTHRPAASECENDDQCGEEEQCFPRLGSTQCLSPQQYMKLQFEIGKPCSSEDDCPEACWTSAGTCGPFLRLRMGTSSPETGSDMDKIPQKSGRSFKIPQKGTRSFRMDTKSPETGTDMDKIPQGTNS